MVNTADVVVVGGGVHGASIAYALAARGVRATLLEKGALASGASGRSSALIRMHYTNIRRFAQGRTVEGPYPYATRRDHQPSSPEPSEPMGLPGQAPTRRSAP